MAVYNHIMGQILWELNTQNFTLSTLALSPTCTLVSFASLPTPHLPPPLLHDRHLSSTGTSFSPHCTPTVVVKTCGSPKTVSQTKAICWLTSCACASSKSIAPHILHHLWPLTRSRPHQAHLNCLHTS